MLGDGGDEGLKPRRLPLALAVAELGSRDKTQTEAPNHQHGEGPCHAKKTQRGKKKKERQTIEPKETLRFKKAGEEKTNRK